MNVLLNRLDSARLFEVQSFQYQDVIYLADSVGASTQKLGRVTVSNLGHFHALYVTGSMTTQYDTGGGAVDTGINYLRAKLIDGSNGRPLFNDYIPLNLFLSPGRRRSLTGAGAGGESGSLFYPLPFEYLFTANSEIQIDVKNDSNVANAYSLAFFGVRVLAAASVAGV